MPVPSLAPCREVNVPFGCDDEILGAFDMDGYVVVTEVLSDAEVTTAVDELWTSPRLLGRSAAILRDDPSTWGGEHWPQQDGGKNFLESMDPFSDQVGWELHQHPRVVHVLRLLYRGPVFASEVGRFGVMRPTAQHPQWRTDANWLHWDQNPWYEPDFGRIQAFVCLSDQTPTSGGLLCVPGFHHKWKAWGEAHPEGTVLVDGQCINREYGRGRPFPVPDDDPLQQQVVRVLAPRGALVLWDGRLPHQNYPNTGTAFRIVHYLAFDAANAHEMAERQETLRKRCIVRRVLGLGERCFFPKELSDLGRQVLCVVNEPATEEDEIDAKLRRAIEFTVEAGEDELKGELQASVEKMARAEKIWPEIEKWHGAIFGN